MKSEHFFAIGTDVRNGIKGVILFDDKHDKNMVLAIYPPKWNEYTGTALRKRFEIQDQPTDDIVSKLVEQIMLYRKLIHYIDRKLTCYIDKRQEPSSNGTFYEDVLEDIEDEEGDSLYESTYKFAVNRELQND